jgi:hypothetical protein
MENTDPRPAASPGQATSESVRPAATGGRAARENASAAGAAGGAPAAAAAGRAPAAAAAGRAPGAAPGRAPGAAPGRAPGAAPGRAPAATAGRPGPQPRVRLSSPADVLALVPHLLGFHPARSLVVIGAGGPRGRVRFGCRYDLPDPPDAAHAAAIAQHAAGVLTRERLSTVIAVGYGPGRLVTPLADVLVPVLRERGLTLRELLRAEDGRYWSYLCAEPACCPPDGVPYDPGSHPVAAAMTVAGLPAYPDRETLARSLDPVTGKAAELMRAAVSRAYDRAGALVAQAAQAGQADVRRDRPGADPGRRAADPGRRAADPGRRAGGARGADPQQGGALRLVVAEGKRVVREVIAACRAGSAITDDQLAWLAVTLTDLRVRDDAWARMEPEHAAAHLRLWTDLVRRVEPALVPAPAALLAFVAWQSGNGALAGMAIERALAADPAYSLALLLRDVVAAGVPPSAARLPMTPEEVEESYERAGPPPQGRRRAPQARRRTPPGRR